MKTFKWIFSLGMVSALTGCFSISTPLQKSKALDMQENEQVVIGITHVMLNEDSQTKQIFWQQTSNVLNALQAQQGYLGHRVRREIFGSEGWTMTIWENEDALQNFIVSPAHTQAMASGLKAVKDARFLRMTINSNDIPSSWEVAEQMMNKNGRSLYSAVDSAGSPKLNY